MTFSFLRSCSNVDVETPRGDKVAMPVMLNIPAETETRRRRFDQARDVGTLYRAVTAAGGATAMETAD